MAPPSIASQLFGYAGVGAAACLFLSPVPTCRRILRARDSQSFSALPYLSQFVESSWWMLWAWAAGDRMEMLVNNIIGASISLIYSVLFVLLANRERRVAIWGQASLAFVLVAVAVVCAILLEEPDMVFGTTAVTLNAIKYSAPLSVVRLVIRTRSVEFMPLPLTLASLACSIFWGMHGLLLEDWFITAPNIAGSIFGTIQLVIYMHYRKETEEPDVEASKEEPAEKLAEKPRGQAEAKGAEGAAGAAGAAGAEGAEGASPVDDMRV